MKSKRGMSPLFNPEAIAVVGVSTDPTKAASIIYENLMSNANKGLLKARIYPVNPSYQEVNGVVCYPKVSSIDSKVDLAIIAVPAISAIDVLEDAGECGVPSAVIISSGFKEAGNARLDDELHRICETTGISVLGPNTIGLVDPHSGVNTFFIPRTRRLPSGEEVDSLPVPRKGGIAILSQSGYLGEMIGDLLNGLDAGVRCIVGLGNQTDIAAEDLISFLGDDALTTVIALYIESLKDGRRFVDVATRVSSRKPIIVLKAGKTVGGAAAAYTHTASIVGDYRVYRSVFKQTGIVEVENLDELIDACRILDRFHVSKGDRLMIVTNAGGSGVLAADQWEGLGLQIIPPSLVEVQKILGELKLGFAGLMGKGNPFDTTALAKTDEFVDIVRAIVALSTHDMYLFIPTHQPPTIDCSITEKLGKVVKEEGKPAVACVMGEATMSKIMAQRFEKNGILVYPTPERAARALQFVLRFSQLKNHAVDIVKLNPLEERLAWLEKEPYGPLDYSKCERLLTDYRIPCAKSCLATGGAEAARIAEEIGYPVVLKIMSKQLSHKRDFGGVLLGLSSPEAVLAGVDELEKVAIRYRLRTEGYLVQKMIDRGTEMLIGGFRDRVFGPIISVGVGGTYTELLKDFSLRMAPVGKSEGTAMLKELILYPILEGYRGGFKADIQSLSSVIESFSRMLLENPSLEQFEINPLMVTDATATAVDVRGLRSNGPLTS